MPKTPRRTSLTGHTSPESLTTSATLYAEVFDRSPVPMWIVDAATFKVLAVNDAAVRGVGYTRPELLDLTLLALCPPETLAAILADPPITGGPPHAHLGVLRRQNGGFIAVHMTWTSLTIQGKPSWLVVMTTPIAHEPLGLDLPKASEMFACPLPTLTAELMGSHRELQADLAQCRATEAQLRSTLGAREVQLRALTHQVKTTLQLATSLFNLQRAQYQDPRLIAPLAASAQRLQALALFHEAVEPGSPVMDIDGSAYVWRLQATLIRTTRMDPQRIVLTADLGAVRLAYAHAIPCGLIFNELLTNAVMHAFPGGRSGVVSVELRDLPEDMVMLRVTDTGAGVPAALDIHQPTRLGWQLVNLLTQQLQGGLTLERDGGTRITVRWSRKHGSAT